MFTTLLNQLCRNNFSSKMYIELLYESCHTRTTRNRRSHVNEAKCTARKGLSAARATCDLGLRWRAADAVLAEAAALVGHRGAAVGDGLVAEVAAHKHLQSNRGGASKTQAS